MNWEFDTTACESPHHLAAHADMMGAVGWELLSAIPVSRPKQGSPFLTENYVVCTWRRKVLRRKRNAKLA